MVNFDIDGLVKKAGGRFRLVSLMQKRMRELQRGLPPLVEKKGSLLETAIDELNSEKLWLAMGEEASKLRDERTAELQAHPGPSAQTPPALSATSTPPKKPPS